jgi:hypothetical protein
MNPDFFKTLNFDKTKLKKKKKFECFLDVSNSDYYKSIEDEINSIMKTKGPL